MTDLDRRIADARHTIDTATARLETIIAEACPGPHDYHIQGRWLICPTCRRTPQGDRK